MLKNAFEITGTQISIMEFHINVLQGYGERRVDSCSLVWKSFLPQREVLPAPQNDQRNRSITKC